MAASAEASEFVQILKLIGRIVQWCVEASLDLVLFVLLLVALLLPWRAPAVCIWVCKRQERKDTRQDLRFGAILHIAVAVGDLIVAPFALIALLIPTRTAAVIEALWYSRIQDEDEEAVWLDGGYNGALRAYLVLSFFECILDILSIPFLLVALLQVGRIPEIVYVSYRLLTNIEPGSKKSRWLEPLSRLRCWWLRSFVGAVCDIPCLVCGLISLVCPTRILPILKGMAKLWTDMTWPDVELLRGDKVTVFPWASLRLLCLQNLAYAFVDLIVLPFLVVACISGVRTLPLMTDLRRDRLGSPKKVKVSLDGRGSQLLDTISGVYHLCGVYRGWPLYEQEAEVRKANQVDDGTVLVCNSKEEAGLAIFESLRSYTAVRRVHNGHAVEAIGKPQWIDGYMMVPIKPSGAVQLDFFDIDKEASRESLHKEKEGAALMGFWGGSWHIFFKGAEEDPTVTMLASNEKDVASAPRGSPITHGDLFTWKSKLDAEGDEVIDDRTRSAQVTSVAEAEHFPFGDYQRYNVELRLHALRHGCYAILDVAFLPFFLLVMLSVYRFPAVLKKMNEDAVAEGQGKGLRVSVTKTADISSNVSFGWKSRLEVMRQSLMLVCDALIFPLLILCLGSAYRMKNLRGKFRYENVRFHGHVLFNASVITGDVVLFLPGLLLMATFYRWQFVLKARKEFAQTAPGWRWRVELLRQAGLLLVDVAIALPCCLVFGTRYQWPACAKAFSPATLEFHAKVLGSAAVVLHDLLLSIALGLPLAISWYRLRFIRDVARTAPSDISDLSYHCLIRGEVYRQGFLLLCDLLVTLPLSLVLMSRYRSPRLTGKFSPKNLDFHGAVLKNAAVVFHDLLLMAPLAFLLTLTYYRLRFVRRILARPAPTDAQPSWEDDLQWEARAEVYIQSILLLFDILVAPMLLFVLAGWHHRQPDLREAFGTAGFFFHLVVIVEFFILGHDVLLFLIMGSVLALSCYRLPHVTRSRAKSRPEHTDMASKDPLADCKRRQSFTRKLVYAQAGLLFCDALVALPLLFVVASYYRARHLSGRWNYDDLQFHCAVLWNACIVVHDLFFLLPISVLLLLTIYRSQPVLALLWKRSTPACPADDVEGVEDLEVGCRAERIPAPDNWQAVNDELIAADSRWAEYIDWARAPEQPEQAMESSASRTHCWKAFCNLLIDLPFVLVGSVVLLCIWRSLLLIGKLRNCRNACEGRWEVLRQFVLTIRDLLFLPVFLLVLCSPYVVGFFGQLLSKLNKPLQTGPMLRVERVQISVPEKGKTILSVEARLEKPLDALVAGSLKLQVLGPVFWRSIERAFGSTAVGVAQGFLPLKLGCRDTDAYEIISQASRTTAETLAFAITMPISVKRSVAEKNLAKLAQDSSLLMQLEARTVVGQKIVLASMPLKLSAMTSIVASGVGDLSGESLNDEELVRQCHGGEHKGLVESFWMLCATSGVQAALDYAHVVLSLLTLVTPWNFIGLLVCLCEPKIRWPVRVSGKAVRVLENLHFNLRDVRGELVAICNSTAKDTIAAQQWCVNGIKPKALEKFKSKALAEHKMMAATLRGMQKHLPDEVAVGIYRWLEMQDACLYHTALRCYVNCMLISTLLKVEEHGLLLDRVQSAEVSLQAATERVRLGIIEEVARTKQAAYAEGCRKAGCCRKDGKLLRRVVRAFALSAVTDIAGLVLLSLLLCTVYRVPLLIRDVVRNNAYSPTSMVFQLLVIRHLRATASDLLHLFQVVVLALLVTVTLVRIPYALNEAAASHHSLEALRDMLLKQLREVCGALWELLSLFTVLKYYKLLARAVIQCCLVPPACLSELVGRICRCLPLCLRFSVSFLLFYILAFVPALPNWFDLSTERLVVRNVFLGASAGVLICNMASVFSRQNFFALPCKAGDWVPATVRLTWCNLLSVLSVLGQPCLLCLVLVSLHRSMMFGSLFCAHEELLQWVAIAICSAWVLVISVMFVAGQSDDYKLLQASPVFRGLHLFLSQLCFLPLVICAVAPTLGLGCEVASILSWPECKSLMVCYAYVLTTQMLSSDAGALEALPMECGIDVRYAPLYLMGAQFADVCIVALPLVVISAEKQLIASLAISSASFLWTSSYHCIRASPACCVPYITALRAGGSFAVAWTSLFLLMTQGDYELPDWTLMTGLAACAVISVLVGLWARWRDHERRRLLMKESGVFHAIEQLAHTEEELCVKDAVLGGWSEQQRRTLWQRTLNQAHTPASLGQCLLCFESHVLAERLSDDFLAKRKQWRSDVDRAGTFPELVHLGLVLQNSLRLPSTVPRLLELMGRLMKRHDLARHSLDYVVGHDTLSALFEEALLARTSAPQKRCGNVDIGLHCERVRSVTAKVMREFSADSFCAQFSQKSSTKIQSKPDIIFFTPEGVMCTEVPKHSIVKAQVKPKAKRSSHRSRQMEEAWSTGSPEGSLPSMGMSILAHPRSDSPISSNRSLSGRVFAPKLMAEKIGRPEPSLCSNGHSAGRLDAAALMLQNDKLRETHTQQVFHDDELSETHAQQRPEANTTRQVIRLQTL